MKIGNWEVTESAIEWKGTGRNKFVIDNRNLTEKIGTEGEDDDDEEVILYKWIILATEKEWLTEDDLYDLNFAFVFAAAQTKAAFDYQVFDETLSFQYSQLEVEDEDEDSDEDEGDDDDDNGTPKGGRLTTLDPLRNS
ncbi:MAG: hypothetical protein EOO04_10530 [Chitinophagaceae bacterium]|nr:MAG: hypothetical protein EOO04_10530 [Chitinophagaceae bacterium]